MSAEPGRTDAALRGPLGQFRVLDMQLPLCGDAGELQLPHLWLGQPAVQQVTRAVEVTH
jgi:hypothetical protein